MADYGFGASENGGALRYLIGFTAWTGAHVAVIGGFRLGASIMNGAKTTQFPSDKPDTHPIKSPMYARVLRAHANCLENLPLFAAVVLVNYVTKGPNIDQLAQIYFWSRILQSVTHWASVSETAIGIRFAFFLSQIACLSAMGWKTFAHLCAHK